MKTPGYVKLIDSADTNKDSVLEMNILPGEKTPWHYHNLFSETFEILKGSLEVGKGKDIVHLKQGDIATIKPNEKHYYHNVSNASFILLSVVEWLHAVIKSRKINSSLFIMQLVE